MMKQRLAGNLSLDLFKNLKEATLCMANNFIRMFLYEAMPRGRHPNMHWHAYINMSSRCKGEVIMNLE